MKRRIKKLIVIALFLLAFGFLFHYCFHDYMNLETIKTHKEFLQSTVAQHYGLTAFFYSMVYIFAVIFMLPFISLLSVLGGFLFGTFWATIFVDISATMGVFGIVFILRYFLRQNKMLVHGSSLEHFNRMIARHGIIYLLCVRLIFVIPFFIVNSLLALTTIPITTIAWTTSVGILPTTLFFTSAGSYLDHINSLSDIFSLKMIMIFGLLIALVLAPLLLKKIKVLQ